MIPSEHPCHQRNPRLNILPLKAPEIRTQLFRPRKTQRLVEFLRRARADVTIRFLNAGHGLTNGEIEIARDWLAKS